MSVPGLNKEAVFVNCAFRDSPDSGSVFHGLNGRYWVRIKNMIMLSAWAFENYVRIRIPQFKPRGTDLWIGSIQYDGMSMPETPWVMCELNGKFDFEFQKSSGFGLLQIQFECVSVEQ